MGDPQRKGALRHVMVKAISLKLYNIVSKTPPQMDKAGKGK